MSKPVVPLGDRYGEVWPLGAPIPPSSVDGRTAALRVLQRYISELTFWRPGAEGGGAPIAFTIPKENFHIEMPDYNTPVEMPSIGVVPGKGEYLPVGFGPMLEEETADVFAKGTTLLRQYEYQEVIILEGWCSKRPERRALLAGLDVAFMPSEGIGGLRLLVPEYYRQTVCFTALTRNIPDSPESADNRRIAQVELEMRFNVVQLVHTNTLEPYATLILKEPGEA